MIHPDPMFSSDSSRTGPHPEPLPITPETLARGAGVEPRPRRKWLALWSPSEFLRFEPPKDFVLMGDCHLTRGGITVLGGWPGVGKSRAALGLAIAGATGRSWLGHEIHARFRTIIVQVENGPWRLKNELAEAAQDLDLNDWLRISLPPPFGLAFHEAAFRERMVEVIEHFQPGLVIIDPWNRVAEGDRQADYRLALDAVLECLPTDPAQRPAVLIVHHMRKKSSDAVRKQGRDLLHELAGSYQIGSAARCVFVLEPGSNDTTDPTVVLTCCKNNDGREGAPQAWIRSNGLFAPAPDFDMEAFLAGENSGSRNSIASESIANALRGMAGETRKEAVQRLINSSVCGRTKAFEILASHPQVDEDEQKRLWWRETV